MRFTIIIGLLAVILAGCRNFSSMTETYDNTGKVASRTLTEYKSKFTKKDVGIMTEVEAFKVTTSPDVSSGTVLPTVSLGWFWSVLLDLNMKDKEEMLFVKTNTHWFVNNTSGITMLYIKNNTGKKQNVKIKSKPKFFIDLPMLKFGLPGNDTTVNIPRKSDKDMVPIVKTMTSGDNHITILHKKEN